jgi:hypothetical protein
MKGNWLYILPHPLCPPLLQRRGGRDFREGASPPLLPTFPPSHTKGRGSGGWVAKYLSNSLLPVILAEKLALIACLSHQITTRRQMGEPGRFR